MTETKTFSVEVLVELDVEETEEDVNKMVAGDIVDGALRSVPGWLDTSDLVDMWVEDAEERG